MREGREALVSPRDARASARLDRSWARDVGTARDARRPRITLSQLRKCFERGLCAC